MLDKVVVKLKTGEEPLLVSDEQLNVTLLDFCKWNESDLLSNATRGVLAEFIVATALNLDIKKCREEWAAYDLETPEGIKVEVKSSAYLQTWFQKDYSKISFSTRASKAWNYSTNKFEETSKRQADIYVFCLLKHKDKQTVDPLNLDQWEFYVLSSQYLDEWVKEANTISLAALERMTKPVSYQLLNAEIKRKINERVRQ